MGTLEDTYHEFDSICQSRQWALGNLHFHPFCCLKQKATRFSPSLNIIARSELARQMDLYYYSTTIQKW